MIEKFSPELCQHLSILVPGFEGHYEYVPYLVSGTIEDLLRYEVRCKHESREQLPSPFYDDVKPFPAWQAEDVITNLFKIEENLNEDAAPFFCHEVADKIAGILLYSTNLETAYQKIEEYLWTLLGNNV